MEETIEHEEVVEEIESNEEKVGYDNLPFNKLQEELVDVLVTKTGNDDRNFFRVMVAYKLCEISSNMRATINYAGTKGIPTNMYALALAPSGYSKNASMNVLEKEVFREFKDEFMTKTFLDLKDAKLGVLAGELEILMGMDGDDAMKKIREEYERLPKYIYSFGSSTPEGFKAMRTKLSMAGIGATSNIIDEIGSNLTNNKETLNVQLEAFDMGDSKQKLIKVDSNTDMKGSVPSNLFAFGTQSKLLDGGNTEKEFFEFLETGYGRRFIIGFVDNHVRETTLSAEQIYDNIMNPMIDASLISYSKYFKDLADKTFYGVELGMSKDNTIKLIEYRKYCDERANALKEHQDIQKAVLKHSYWRVLKIAGAYAFAEKSIEITSDNIDNAIALSEEGIKSFVAMLSRKKPYERLADYISEVDKKITQVDLVEDLPFYKGSESQRKDLLSLAIAYGYNNNIIIKRTIKDGIEFLEGDSLKETDTNKITCSWSKDIAKGYTPAVSAFENLHQLVCGDGFHYCSHSFEGGHRTSEKAIEGFNLLILDVDGGLPLETCKKLMNEYKFLIATTKRHQTAGHGDRYRIVLPLNYEIKLNPEDHKKFMKNVFDFLPFESDEQTADIARKWQSHKGSYVYNDGKLFDALPFIPNTSKEEKQREVYGKYEGVEALQKWFLINNIAEDGRNNMLLKYALALLDNGLSSDNIRHSVHDFNTRLDEPIGDREIEQTVMKTVIRKEIEREK